jgi:hypothetical protein
VSLRSASTISLSAGQRFRIVEDDTIEDGPYRVHTVEYWYLFSLEDGRDILAYHWTPELSDRQRESGQRAYPHIHIGPALLASDSPIFPTTLHKKHVPSGRVSIESVVRFAIEELGVSPILPNWDDILTRNQSQFDQYRRR